MLHHLLPPNRKKAPAKKCRGLKRYFRCVFAQAESSALDLSDDAWFDYHHVHLDWYGYGNLSWRMRARHLEALALVFARYARQLTQFGKPYQLWIYLDARDAGQDAVFVHSPNPNHGNFPLVLDDAEWDIAEVSQYFERLLPGYRLRAGHLSNAAGYCIYSPDIGLSLEQPNP